MRSIILLIALLFGIGFTANAAKRDPNNIPYQFGSKDNLELKQDRAYLLFRVRRMLSFRFLHVPDGFSGDAAKAAIEPKNLIDVAGLLWIEKDAPIGVVVVSVPAGTYWLYGEKTAYYIGGLERSLNCLCLGTIKFEAKAGVLTDLGEIRQLYTETKNGKQPDAKGRVITFLNNRDIRGIQVDPFQQGDYLPAKLATMPRVAADYYAAGFLPNIEGVGIDRISAMPGIIGYDAEKVVDLRAK